MMAEQAKGFKTILTNT